MSIYYFVRGDSRKFRKKLEDIKKLKVSRTVQQCLFREKNCSSLNSQIYFIRWKTTPSLVEGGSYKNAFSVIKEGLKSYFPLGQLPGVILIIIIMRIPRMSTRDKGLSVHIFRSRRFVSSFTVSFTKRSIVFIDSTKFTSQSDTP